MSKRGQTSTEYMILVAVVIVVAVIVSSILGDFPGMGNSAKGNIDDYKLSTSKIGVGDYYIGTTYSLFKIANNHYDNVRADGMYVNDINCTTSDLPATLKIGQSLTVNCSNINSTNVTGTPDIEIIWTDLATSASYGTAPSSGGSEGGSSIPESFDLSLSLLFNDTFVNKSTYRTEIHSAGSRLDAPLLYMNFNTPPEGTYVQDNSIYNNFGTNTGATYDATCTDGPDGGCYSFDGINNRISVSVIPQIQSKITVGAWIYPTALGTYNEIVHIGQFGATNNVFFRLESDSKLHTYIDKVGGNYIHSVSSGIVPLNSWSYVTAVFDGNKLQLYINGVASGLAAVGTNANPYSTIARIGCYIREDGEWFTGSMDQVQIWNRALTAEEVLELYQTSGASIGKYADSGNITSKVYYNDSATTYWNVTTNAIESDGAADSLFSDPNLVSYWKLDGDYNDSVGDNDGVATGTNNATGLSSGAMYFDGVDDYVNMGNPSNLQLSNSDEGMAVSTWVRHNNIDDFNVFLAKGYGWSGATEYDFNFGTWNTNILQISVASSDSHIASLSSDETLDSDTWYHAVFSWDGSTDSNALNLYLDGVLIKEGTATGALSSMSTNHNFALADQNQLYGLGGNLDEVMVFNRSLTPSEVEQLYKAGLSKHANAQVVTQTRTASSYNLSDAGLVSHWGLNGNPNDEKGINNGTVTGAISGESYGVVGEGYSFDGDNDYINATQVGPTGSSNRTISAWIKVQPGATYPFILSYGAASNYQLFQVLLRSTAQGGKLALDFQNANYWGTANVRDGNWHHVVAVLEGTQVQDFVLYVDGEVDPVTTTTNPSSTVNTGTTYPIYIGRSANTENYFNGSIDEVRLYNRSLSAAEIQNLYKLGSEHINWNDWQSNEVNPNPGKFMQFRTLLTTNDTDVTPYAVNATISTG